jgi:hypothetical protein
MKLDKDYGNLTGIENNEIWLSVKEVTELESITERWFWKRFRGYRYTYRYVASENGGRGGKRVEVALSSLSTAGQGRYLEQLYNRHVTTKELAETYQINVPEARLQDPTTAQMVRMTAECLAIPKGARGRREAIAQIAAHYGRHPASAYRLLQRAEAGKPLFKEERRQSGVSLPELGFAVRAWDEAAARMAVGIALENRRRQTTGVELYRRIQDTAEAEGLRIGSYRSFAHLKSRVDATPLAVFRDKGRAGLRQDVIAAIRRDATAYRPMEVLIGDQHKADYYAFDSAGRVVTLELFCWMDFRTQLAWGSVAYQHYNRYTVGRALTNAVRWGLPTTLYTDWGKPEQSDYITHLIEQLTGLGIRTDSIQHVTAEGRHPQAKPIEGFFGNFDKQVRNAGIPGYMKRLRDPREGELQQKEIKETIRAEKLLSVDDLTTSLFDQLEQWNKHQFKNRGEDNGLSPLDIYREEVKQHPVTTLSEEMLDYIFLPVRPLTIKRSSVAMKHEWLGKKVYYDRALADYQGRKAEVRYDPFEPWRAWIFVEKKLICTAEEWGMINPKVSDQVAAKMAEQKRLERSIVERYRKALPPKAPVRRINPAEREARAVSEENRRTGEPENRRTEIRIFETSLEKRAAEQGARSGIDHDTMEVPAWRRQYQPGAQRPDEEERPKFVRPFVLSMKHTTD